MKTMGGVKKCGSLKSMRHVTTRPYEDKSVPHLALYVQHMNKTKLVKEREVIKNRLMIVEQQIKDIDKYIISLQPKLGLPKAPRRTKRKKDELPEKKRINKSMKLSF